MSSASWRIAHVELGARVVERCRRCFVSGGAWSEEDKTSLQVFVMAASTLVLHLVLLGLAWLVQQRTAERSSVIVAEAGKALQVAQRWRPTALAMLAFVAVLGIAVVGRPEPLAFEQVSVVAPIEQVSVVAPIEQIPVEAGIEQTPATAGADLSPAVATEQSPPTATDQSPPVEPDEEAAAAELVSTFGKDDESMLLEFHLEHPIDVVFATLWESASFYEEVLAEEEPRVGAWNGSTRIVETRHPLAVNMPRWTGLAGLSIPTVKTQRAVPPLVVHERSTFAGFPMAQAIAVETAWIFNPALDDGTEVTVKFRCTFDNVVPTWLRPTIISKTRQELAIVNSHFAQVARRFLERHDAPVYPLVQDDDRRPDDPQNDPESPLQKALSRDKLFDDLDDDVFSERTLWRREDENASSSCIYFEHSVCVVS